MDSIYDGSGTNLIFTVVGLFIFPLYEDEEERLVAESTYTMFILGSLEQV